MIERHGYVTAHERANGVRVGVLVHEDGVMVVARQHRAGPVTINCAIVEGIGLAALEGCPADGVLVIHTTSAPAIAALAGERPCKGPLAAAVAKVAPRLGDRVIPHFDSGPSDWYALAHSFATEEAS